MEYIIEKLPFSGDGKHFWGAVRIYTEKTHVLNRKVCGSTNLLIGSCDVYEEDFIGRIIDKITLKVNEACIQKDEGSDGESKEKGKDIVNNMDEPELWPVESLQRCLESFGFRFNNDEMQVKEQKGGSGVGAEVNIPWEEFLSKEFMVAVIRKIHPKQLQKFCPQLEVVFLDGRNASATYLTRLMANSSSALPHVNYAFKYTGDGISLTALKDNGNSMTRSDSSNIWLKNTVLPKLLKWATEIEEEGIKEGQGSLALINVQEYNQLYQMLKVKYGQPLVEKWTETTDPQKFVFEDVAISAYLLLLWKKEREVKGLSSYQTFVDMGCGNGLLVYILSGEGHRGIGIDLKKRNIWDMFPKDVVLQEGIIEPSDKHLFPEYDWLIGNHSDELTPWLPVIAAKSKFTTSFFVIPCCAHDFDCKFRRRLAGQSQYADYISYVKEIGTVCGFKIEEDRLRIPSTKRVCLIGQERIHGKDQSGSVLKEIDDFIQMRNEFNAKAAIKEKSSTKKVDSNATINSSKDNLWSANFKARESVQPVRNCTRLKEEVKDDLLATVVNILLEKKFIVEVNVGCPKLVSWDRGGSIKLHDLAKRIGPQQLSALKNECGGLQTLLKNHKHMFTIRQGDVSLQVPVTEWKATVPKDRIKTKPCWFYLNHYQSCPLPAAVCIYAHGDNDIKKADV